MASGTETVTDMAAIARPRTQMSPIRAIGIACLLENRQSRDDIDPGVRPADGSAFHDSQEEA